MPSTVSSSHNAGRWTDRVLENIPHWPVSLAVLTDLGTETAIEFLRRLEADLPRIGRRWGIEQPGSVVRFATRSPIRTEAGDRRWR